ncbi:MAG: hypothetical protein D6773_11375 [Alphaproteobacteria bacterium]|nr:MAG: hypothetical protein D6773_11375 [Alphaproteobacteria bacterium]
MRQWAERHEDFASALTRAKELEQAYWEELGEKGLFADRFNAPVWKMMMASRFRADYSPTTRIEGSGGGAIQITLSRDDEKL